MPLVAPILQFLCTSVLGNEHWLLADDENLG